MIVLFWSCLGLILYTYFGYPALLYLSARGRPEPAAPALSPDQLPAVTVVIPAYNEQQHIAAKLRSVLESNYPADRLQVLVVVDGASDATASIARGIDDPRLRVIEKPVRAGKPAALNDAMALVRTPLTILTDAAELLEHHTIRRLVRRFEDPAIGAVSGEIVMVDAQSGFSQNLGLYWRYETFIRACEARVGSVVGATGPLYAIRTALYRPLPPDTVLDDVAIPFEIVRQHYRVGYARDACASERSTPSGPQEFVRKRRTLAGNYQLISRYWQLLLPGSPIAWQFWSHKVARLLVPYALAGLLAACLTLKRPWADVLLLLQAGFYLLATWTYLRPASKQRPWLALPYTFCLLNWAAFSGSLYYFTGRLSVRWEKVK
ncbi:MAG TPA: glycosyltransferase family 2 protein [Acidiferrobacteraceae bacterium]|nr:glycosyltransferase family 2 protein [Acidiferrobacteraceae bacterium]